ncbi:RDD family protein [Akkermansiaceae bacterium]|nr:RDD family protein [Akkermansiaceae bacterium]
MISCGMEEKEEEKPKKTLPPPTIKNTPPVKPPTTTADAAPAPEKKEEQKKSDEEEKSTDEIVAESENEQGAEADLGNRIIGGLIDGFVVFGLSIITSLVLTNALSFMGQLIGIAYLLTRDSLPFLDGQSIGKKVVGTKAVREDGTPLTNDYKTGALRNVWMLLPFVEPIVLIVRKDKPDAGRRLGDDSAKTKVINVG